MFNENALMDFKTKQIKDFVKLNYEGFKTSPPIQPYYVYPNINKMMKLNGTYHPERKLQSTGSFKKF